MNDTFEFIADQYPTWKYRYKSDWEWLETVKSINIDYQTFMLEYAFVVLNSGFRAQTVAKIWPQFKACFYGFNRYILPEVWRVDDALETFGNVKKVGAIENTGKKFQPIGKFEEWWSEIWHDKDKALVAFEKLPFIGPITKYHLARNLGIDCYKPDRWIIRVAQKVQMEPDVMFEHLSHILGDSTGIIDMVLWRACEQGELSL